MALQVWLPLNGMLENKGLSNVTVTNGGATVDNNGKIGKCYSFDGNDDYIAFSGNFFKGGTSYPFSICMWIYQNDTNRAVLFGDYNLSGNLNFNIELRAATDPSVRFYWGGSPDLDLGTIPSSQWTHLCITYDGTTLKQYNNGTLVDSKVTSLSNKTKSSGNFYIGRDSRTGVTALAGKVNDFRIYDHALSPKEVKEISKGLILHYKLNDIDNLIPDGVELYDYIQSSGTQWIDTGYVPKGNFGTDIKFQLINTSSFATIWGSMPSSSQITPRTGFHNYPQSQWMAGINATSSFGTANTSVHTLKQTFSNGTETMILDGNQVYTGNPGATALSSNNLSIGLFARNQNPVTNYTSMKCYYFSINDGSKLVRNFLPCTYLGEPGMWDTVENRFYGNQGTGQFTLGNKITLKEYQYLSTSGNQSIDTGIQLEDGHSLTYDIIFKYENNGVRRLMGPSAVSGSFFGVNTQNQYEYTSLSAGNVDHLYEDFDLINYKLTSYINNTKYRERSINASGTVGHCYIFSLAGTNRYTGGGQYFYSGKILYDKKIVRDFIPVSYNGTPGLWDKIEWKFYANAGSGSFILGPEKIKQNPSIVCDCSGYNNNGTITGTLTTSDDSPRYTKSTVFNGSSCINAGHNAKVKDAITVCAWAYMNTWTVSHRIISCTESGGWTFYAPSSALQFYIGTGTSSNVYKGAGTITAAQLSSGWHHFVGTYDGLNVKLYVDGVLNQSVTAYSTKTPIHYNSSAPIWIGAESQASSTQTSPYFNGRISDVRIYATALSADDVKELYNTSAFICNNGSIEAYEFIENTGSPDIKKNGIISISEFIENSDLTKIYSDKVENNQLIEI